MTGIVYFGDQNPGSQNFFFATDEVSISLDFDLLNSEDATHLHCRNDLAHFLELFWTVYEII